MNRCLLKLLSILVLITNSCQNSMDGPDAYEKSMLSKNRIFKEFEEDLDTLIFSTTDTLFEAFEKNSPVTFHIKNELPNDTLWSGLIYFNPESPEEYICCDNLDTYTENLRNLLSVKFRINGQPVQELKGSDANRRIAITLCQAGRPTIMYAKRYDQRVVLENFIFFRFHEYAHLKLYHTGCGIISEDPAMETNADLEAARILCTMEGGEGIVRFAAGSLAGFGQREQGAYPSSRARSKLLMKFLRDRG